MMYKPSLYNCIVQNSNNDYLVYNSCVGTKSFIKLSGEQDIKLHELLLCDSIEEKELASISKANVLVEKGLIVPVEQDERYKLKMIYNSLVNDSTLELTLLPTEMCNFSCKYCYESFQNGKMENGVQDRIISFVKKNIKKYTGLNVSWFGGEPLIAADVIENLSQSFTEKCNLLPDHD